MIFSFVIYFFRSVQRTAILVQLARKTNEESQESEFLKFAREKKLLPGREVRIMGSEIQADAVTLKVGRDQPFSLGFRSAEKILVLEVV